MKKLLFTFTAILTFSFSYGQISVNDFGRIVINSYLPEDIAIPAEAKKQLQSKLDQITSNYGIGGSQVNPRFIITASVNIGTKDIIAGPPQMIAQNLELTLFIGDSQTNTIFSNCALSIKGVGTNENKAFIEALKSVNPKNSTIKNFIEESKVKILQYYESNCPLIIKHAQSIAKQGKYDEAIYELSLVPNVCSTCYYQCLDTIGSYYQRQIDTDGLIMLKVAKAAWAASPNQDGAREVSQVIVNINPMASCQKQVEILIQSIEEKLKSDQAAEWKLKLKQYEDQVAMEKEKIRLAEEKSKRDATLQEQQSQRNHELDKMRVGAYQEIALAYAKSINQVNGYNNINWR